MTQQTQIRQAGRRAKDAVVAARAALDRVALALFVQVLMAFEAAKRRYDSVAVRTADETGAGLVEYILIILVVAILAIVFLTQFRKSVGSGFNRAGNCISGNVNTGNC